MMREFLIRISAVTAAALLLLGLSGIGESLAAQSGSLGARSLRSYWHVFVAYGLAWLLVLGWVVSVFRRLGSVDRDME